MEQPSRTILIYGQGGVQTDLDLDSLDQDQIADIIPDMLTDYAVECREWTIIAGEHLAKKRYQRALDLLNRGVHFFTRPHMRRPDALVNIHAMLAHIYLDLARDAPKHILQNSKYDKIDPSTKTKEFYFREAAANLNASSEALRNAGATVDDEPVSLTMGRIIHHLATGQPSLAHPLVERLLSRQPNNIPALLAHARLQFARRLHEQALATYQQLLRLAPEMTPDPRIGLGLCFWQLGDKEKARTAWERALERDTGSWVCLLLLGLASLNQAREPSVSRTDRLQYETQGVGYVQKAFKLNNKSSAAAHALATVSGHGGQIPLASKLAERAIQYADNKRHAVAANAERGRLGFVAGDVVDAGHYIAAVKAEDPAAVNVVAELTLGQIAIQNDNLREALNYIEQTAKKLNGRGPLEYTVLHACLLAYPHPGMPQDEVLKNRAQARGMLEEVHNLVASAESEEDWAKLRGVGTDADVFVDLAKLWQGEDVDKAIGAYQTALSIISDNDLQTTSTELQPPNLTALRLSDNLGALYHLQGNVETAERMYQEALQKIQGESGKEAEVLKTVLAYNLGRAYEEGGDSFKAAGWYRDVLRQHPEHVESKVRLALIASAAGRVVDAHTLLKECLLSDENNLTVRSVYTNFLISIGSHKEAFAFTSSTLKVDRNDVWTFCALGWLHFTLGREAKSSQELAERSKQYLRSAEAYERALLIDHKCAFAAQGLAIALVEDTLAPRGTNYGAEEGKVRARIAGKALGIFSRIQDSLAEGPVSVNMGHCYFIRGEEEKAIQSYGTASNAYGGKDVSTLLYLARAWYALATRTSNFSAMSKALAYSQTAFHLLPSDRAILYNIAMIQQKAAEMLFSLPCEKRTLEELQLGLRQAEHAAKSFRGLADDKTRPLPYDVDLADQRARYGEGLLRRAPGEMTKQETFEGEALARVEEARKTRAEEHAKIQAAEEARQEELRAKAEELAEQRKKAREEAMAWQEELAARHAEEEAKRLSNAEKRKRKKDTGVIDSGDEEGTKKEKKQRKKKPAKEKKRKQRSKSEVSSDEEEASASGEEEETEESIAKKAKNTLAMLKAKRKSKRTDPDEDDDEDEINQGQSKKGKQFKSKAYISDSEEESDAAEANEPTQEGSASPEKNGGMEVDEEDE
ncbi:hypothetical protein B9479_003959 [Cryptococcus floricola]|uniref:RNA polymerase-associated protein CTR9 n=1 Tax=Cryptococcus floricola TaxID=2591691 RepID=A0A5D3AXP5_9TREE|nr:hypothetical protein B9479_003959 [Cryptococcus floricola]